MWAARGVCAPWRSLREAALGPSRPLPRLRNGSSQQPKFCLVSRGASSPAAARGRRRGHLLPSIKGNKHRHAHARTPLERPADGCVLALGPRQAPASPSGGRGGCALRGRECVWRSGRRNVTRRPASPAAARGRRGGRAAGLLPASRYGGGCPPPFAAPGAVAEGPAARMSVFPSGGRRLL